MQPIFGSGFCIGGIGIILICNTTENFSLSIRHKGALLYIAFCYVVRIMIKAKLHLAAWL